MIKINKIQLFIIASANILMTSITHAQVLSGIDETGRIYLPEQEADCSNVHCYGTISWVGGPGSLDGAMCTIQCFANDTGAPVGMWIEYFTYGDHEWATAHCAEDLAPTYLDEATDICEAIY